MIHTISRLQQFFPSNVKFQEGFNFHTYHLRLQTVDLFVTSCIFARSRIVSRKSFQQCRDNIPLPLCGLDLQSSVSLPQEVGWAKLACRCICGQFNDRKSRNGALAKAVKVNLSRIDRADDQTTKHTILPTTSEKWRHISEYKCYSSSKQ